MAMICFVPPAPLSLEGNLLENWKRFRSDLEIFLKAAGFTETKTTVGRPMAILLNLIGEKGKELYNTFQFEEGKSKIFEEVLMKFEEYVSPQKNLIVSSFRFNSRKQKEQETFDDFVTELRKLVKDYDYGALVDRLLLDRIVQGVQDSQLREKDLQEKEVTLDRAIELERTTALSREQAAKMKLLEVDRIVNRKQPKKTKEKVGNYNKKR
uniref:Retrotransposon gag domain-containing protein n=1 Tax=Rhodnius prolixus TaxID=13249 RepID=T1ICY3_RHOPR